MSEIGQQAEKVLLKRVLAELDLDGMAKKLAPKVVAEMEKGILEGVRGLKWDQIVSDAFYNHEKSVSRVIMNALGIPTEQAIKKK